jgi:superfamily II DNA/RNA helicase
MARAMESLVRYSVHMFHTRLTELQTGTNNQGKKAATNRQKQKFGENAIVREIEKIFEEAQDKNGKVKHPKMEYLQNVVAAHFTGEEEQGRLEDTRIMVFCQFRECVIEIVDILNEQSGINATAFVGQSSDTKGNKGLRQKDQERIVQEFKEGKFNVLVATSIGEEGLDIGEVDLIVCYEAVKNSVRMLQRVGRTGRKRNGRIVVLMSEGPEENNWQQSKDNHKTIQDELINGSHLELFDDVERLVPQDITSVAVRQEVEQPPFEPSMIRAPAKQKKVPKPKRDADPFRNIPKNGLKGFIKVSELKRKKGKESMREGESSASNSPAPLCAASSDEEEGKEGAPELLKDIAMTDDSDDEMLERGFQFDADGKLQKFKVAATSSGASELPKRNVSKNARLGTRRKATLPSPAVSRASASSQIEINLLSSSPPPVLPILQSSRINVQKRISPVEEEEEQEGMFEEIRGNSKRIIPSSPSSPIPIRKRRRPHSLVAKLAAEMEEDDDDDDEESQKEEVVEEEKEEEKEEAHSERSSSRLNVASRKRQASGGELSSENEEASTSLPIVGKRKQSRKKIARIQASSSSPSPSPPVSVMGPPKIPLRKDKGRGSRQKRFIGGSPTSRRLFQYEADRSTDEEIHGEKDEDDDGQDTDEADSSDLEHVGDFAPTQAPRGYNQEAIYLQSLHSQANLTPFKKRARGGLKGFQMGIDSEQVRRSVQDTPGRQSIDEGEGNDEYELDSFVCSDEEIEALETEVESSQL